MKFPGFIGPSYQGQSRSTDAERTVNLFLEQVESGQSKDPTQYSFVKSPGLKLFTIISGSNVIRGLLPVSDVLWVVSGGQLVQVLTPSIITTPFGTMNVDANPVTMCAGNVPAGTFGIHLPQIAIASAGQGYVFDFARGAPYIFPVTQFSPDTAIGGVATLNNFGLFLEFNRGQGFYYSNPGDFLSGTPLNFISASFDANQFIQILVDKRQNIWLFGTQQTQLFYNNAANDPNNPFLPNLSAGLPYGTIAKYSPIEWGGRVGWLTRDFYGQGIFVATDGGLVPSRKSNRAVEYIWSTYSTMADARSYSITIKGHEFLRIYFPSGNTTWEYDPATGDWHEVAYWDQVNAQYVAHLVQTTAACFGTVIGGSRLSDGALYTMSLDNQDDNLASGGTRMRWMRRCPIISNENKFVSYPWFELDMGFGVGDGSNNDPTLGTVTPEANPVVDLRVSKDWGNTFGPYRSRSMGKQGEFNTRMIWTRNSMSRQHVFEISGNASVKTVINGAYLRKPGVRST